MAYTDPTLTPNSTPVKKTHFDELRAKYKAVEGAVTTPTGPVNVAFTGGTATSFTVPTQTQVFELRAAINNLESLFSGNCCQNNCCQTCQGCQACQLCQSLSQCNCCALSCFPAGTLVTMADGSLKKIEEVQDGEMVMGLEGPIQNITLYKNILGDKRNFLKFTDDSLTFTGEHCMWVRKDDKEWWGVRDIHQHLLEDNSPVMVAPDGTEYNKYHLEPTPWILFGEAEYAHLDGWKKQNPVIDRSLTDPMTPVYCLVTKGSHTFFANGYLVSGFVHNTGDTGYDYSTIKWNK